MPWRASYWMSRLMQEYAGQTELALAGYNAGGGRVRKWKKLNPQAEFDEFIESIPFRETRIYVKTILVGHFHYHHLYGNSSRPPDPGSES